MTYRRLVLTGMCLAVVALMTVADASTAQAQRDSGAKARGEFGKGFWSNERASRNMRHARDYSNSFYQYSRNVRQIQPEIAKSESAELGRNIEAAKKEVAVVRNEYVGDKDVLASLTLIEGHLAEAAAHHKTLHAECQKDAIDGEVGMNCCNTITKELEKAIAEHEALRRKLQLQARRDAETKAGE